MSKVKIVSVIYAIGIIIGALFFDVWGADTTPVKTLSIFLVLLLELWFLTFGAQIQAFLKVY